ncbi:hypothetical protein LOD99_11240 [Oopsacas minuta]|uniref:Uncharacterized protein n=1 Tax=Oopsacas minuta TaxID=111878 RepID=A0AAV7K7Q3_9METZ|nr:hypothetical protein LOD99_11240 [Oopsacas minuta]
MATIQPDIPEEDIFEKIAAKIHDNFNEIVTQALSRKDELLLELNELKLAFEINNKTNIDNLKELAEMKSGLEQLALKQNFALKVLEDSVKDINIKIENLAAKSSKPDLKFQCNIVKILANIKNIGQIVKHGEYPKPRRPSETDRAPANRQRESQSKSVIGKKGNSEGNFNCPQKLHVDQGVNFLYVADYYNNRIQIFNTKDWAFKYIDVNGEESYYGLQ